MELHELEKKYEELGEEIKKLKNKKEIKKRWRADLDETYFYIGSDGSRQKIIDSHSENDDYRYKSGNYYRSRQELNEEDNKRMLIQKYKDFILEIEEEPIDWSNTKQNKYYVYIDRQLDSQLNLILKSNHYQSRVQGVVYSTNEKLLELAKERFTDEELKIIIRG